MNEQTKTIGFKFYSKFVLSGRFSSPLSGGDQQPHKMDLEKIQNAEFKEVPRNILSVRRFLIGFFFQAFDEFDKVG